MGRDEQPATPQGVVASVGDVVEDLVGHFNFLVWCFKDQSIRISRKSNWLYTSGYEEGGGDGRH